MITQKLTFSFILLPVLGYIVWPLIPDSHVLLMFIVFIHSSIHPPTYSFIHLFNHNVHSRNVNQGLRSCNQQFVPPLCFQIHRAMLAPLLSGHLLQYRVSTLCFIFSKNLLVFMAEQADYSAVITTKVCAQVN